MLDPLYLQQGEHSCKILYENHQDIKRTKSDCHIIVYHIAAQVYNLPYVLRYILYTIYRLNIHVYSDLYCIIGHR